MAKANLALILERLNSAPQYHPMSAETFADWSTEAGDIVTVSRNGEDYATPIHSMKMKWAGTPSTVIESEGDKELDPVAKMSAKKYSRGGSSLRNGYYQHLYAIDQYTQMVSGLELTGSMAKLYVDDAYSQMSSGLMLTSSAAILAVNNAYTQMTAGLALTSSTALLAVSNAYTQMSAGLSLTSSSAKLYADNKYSQMSAGLELTSSAALLAVSNAYTQMSSGLALSTSSAKLYVDNKYSQMSAGLELSTSSAKLYAGSAENAASIVAQINTSTGQSEIQIDAQKVYIGNQKSTTVIAGKCSLSDITADFIAGKIATIGTLQGIAARFSGNVTSEAILYGKAIMVGESGGTYVNISDPIMAVQISGPTSNTYKLQYKKASDSSWQDAGNFSRAVSSWSTGWSNGKWTAEARPQSQSVWVSVYQGTSSWSGRTVTIPIRSISSESSTEVNATSVTATYPLTKNDMTLTRGNASSSEPSTDDSLSNITGNGWYTLTNTVADVSKTFKVRVNVATTPTLTGTWSNGKLTVSSSPAASEDYVRQLSQNTATWSGTIVTIPVVAVYGSSGQYSQSTGWSASLDVSGKLKALTGNDKITSNGTYNPPSGYIGFSSVVVDVAGGGEITMQWGTYGGGKQLQNTVTASNSSDTKTATVFLNVQLPNSSGVVEVFVQKDNVNGATLCYDTLSFTKRTNSWYGLTRLNTANDGRMALKDRNGNWVAGGNNYYWFYSTNTGSLLTMYQLAE